MMIANSSASLAPTVPIARYVEASRKLDVDGIDWGAIPRHPLPDDARACLIYMSDVEGYTVAYLRDLLNTKAIDDPDIARFLTLWAYEEMFHQEALSRFLAAAGTPLGPDRVAELRRHQTRTDRAMMWLARLASRTSEDFVAVYLAWAAINELGTLTAYTLLAGRAGHPVLTELLRRIVKDERRHFSFYFHHARHRLGRESARRLTAFAVRHFWRPVGDGVKRPEELCAVLGYCLAGERGAEAAREMDATIARLPGLEWFRGYEIWRGRTVPTGR